MENVGSIEYDARINTKTLKADSQEADRIARKTGDSIGENTEKGSNKASAALGALGGIAKTTAIGIGVALSAGIAAAAKASWDQVSAVQASGATLNAYIDDASKVTSIQQDLIKYAKSDLGVLFNRRDLFESASGLAQLGSEAGKIPDQVKILSRAVATGRTDWTNLNDAIADVITTGSIAGPTFDRLQRSGFKLDDSLRNATITSDEFFAALDKGIPKSTLQDMDNIIPLGIRFESAFRGMGDAILGVNDIGDGFNAGSLGQHLIDGIKNFTEFIKRDDVKGTLAAIGTAITTAFTIGKNAISTFNAAVAPLVSWFRQYLLPVIQQVANFVGGVFAQTWKELTTSFNNLRTMLAPFSEQLKILGIIIGVALIAPLLIAIATFAAIVLAITLVVTAIAFVIGKMAEFANFIFSNFEKVASFFASVFTQAVNSIKSVFSTLSGFFQAVWNNIVSMFGTVGTTVGNAIGNTFKGVINSVLRGAVNLINGFINAINGAVDTINKIPGVHIGRLGTLPIPQMAAGGIVTSPTLAMIGEGRESEAVIPLSKLDAMINNTGSKGAGNNINIELNMSGIMGRSKADEREIARNLIKRLNEELQAKGVAPIGGGSL